MVNKYLYILGISILLIGCNEATNNIQQYQAKEEVVMSDENIINQKKDIYDQNYFKSLRNLNLSEKDFLIIVEYVIGCAEEKYF